MKEFLHFFREWVKGLWQVINYFSFSPFNIRKLNLATNFLFNFNHPKIICEGEAWYNFKWKTESGVACFVIYHEKRWHSKKGWSLASPKWLTLMPTLLECHTFTHSFTPSFSSHPPLILLISPQLSYYITDHCLLGFLSRLPNQNQWTGFKDFPSPQKKGKERNTQTKQLVLQILFSGTHGKNNSGSVNHGSVSRRP